jgi:hypothetical protein
MPKTPNAKSHRVNRMPKNAKPEQQSARSAQNPSKTYDVTLQRDGDMSAIPVPFDPKAVFGKVRAPVKVTVNGYTYRSTIAAMGGPPFVPLRKSHREAACLDDASTVTVRLEFDTDKREVTPPADLVRALKAVAGATERWRALSYTHQREHVEAIEGAKKPETRERRIAAAVEMVKQRKLI